MFSFKRSLLPLANLVVLVVALAVLLSPAGTAKEQGLRTFYLTQTTHNGSQALSACAEGYHMASVGEIRDPSNLRYDTVLGVTQDDSGSGPPHDRQGYIRTGFQADDSFTAGKANCQAWTSAPAGQSNSGTTVFLSAVWSSEASQFAPWTASISPCFELRPVWCVQD